MQTLYTKDGRKVGNAILIKHSGESFNGKPLFLVETDFGNQLNLTTHEIDGWFNRGELMDYDQWKRAREDTRAGS